MHEEAARLGLASLGGRELDVVNIGDQHAFIMFDFKLACHLATSILKTRRHPHFCLHIKYGLAYDLQYEKTISIIRCDIVRKNCC